MSAGIGVLRHGLAHINKPEADTQTSYLDGVGGLDGGGGDGDEHALRRHHVRVRDHGHVDVVGPLHLLSYFGGVGVGGIKGCGVVVWCVCVCLCLQTPSF